MVTYKESGVDITSANEAKKLIKSHVAGTFSKNVLTGIGSFGALYSFDKDAKDNPVLVASSDGVGTKLKLAIRSGKFDTVGQDLVNHCVNDILVMGAEPLFFLDYIALGKMEPHVVEQIVKGLAKACRENGCSLIGGETAEMPGIYREGDFDLAGFIVGLVEKKEISTGGKIRKGDSVIGLLSNGLQTNGFSLANRVLFDVGGYELDDRPDELNGQTIAEALMAVHPSYLGPVKGLIRKGVEIRGMAHITGGGLVENVPRVLPNGTSASIDRKSWEIPRVFSLIKRLGNVPDNDMFRTFNMGIGFVIIVAREDEARASNILSRMKIAHATIGRIVQGKKEVLIK